VASRYIVKVFFLIGGKEICHIDKKIGTQNSQCGKNKSRVALICHLFGIDMPQRWHANLKNGKYIANTI